jgi:hypothetical protein
MDDAISAFYGEIIRLKNAVEASDRVKLGSRIRFTTFTDLVSSLVDDIRTRTAPQRSENMDDFIESGEDLAYALASDYRLNFHGDLAVRDALFAVKEAITTILHIMERDITTPRIYADFGRIRASLKDCRGYVLSVSATLQARIERTISSERIRASRIEYDFYVEETRLRPRFGGFKTAVPDITKTTTQCVNVSQFMAMFSREKFVCDYGTKRMCYFARNEMGGELVPLFPFFTSLSNEGITVFNERADYFNNLLAGDKDAWEIAARGEATFLTQVLAYLLAKCLV